MDFLGIESKYNQPTDAKYHVASLAAAVAKPIKYNVPNMVIFVRDEKALYYLKDGSPGNSLSDWNKLSSSNALFAQYVPGNSYALGETTAVGASMFIAIAATTPGQSPLTTPAKWLSLASTQKFVGTFSALTTITVNHAINNAICNVYNAAGLQLFVKITKTSSSQFVINSNQAITGTVIIT